MTSPIKVTVVSRGPGSATWQSKVVEMTRAIVLPDELDEPFGDAATQEWARDSVPPGDAPGDESAH